ncbi:MAG: DUF2844 domain-containing protein [Candidatus Sulfotelmatobacter sp.]
MFTKTLMLTRPVSIKAGLVVGAVALILGAAFPAWASLGGDVSTIQADQVQLQGTRRVVAAQSSTGQAYTVHEIQTANGTVVREYLSSSGMVFGLAWRGHWPPNMRQLLGSYAEQYRQAVNAQQKNSRPGRRPLVVEQPGLVVEMGGHPRAFAGMAYIPDMLPQGVKAEDIR